MGYSGPKNEGANNCFFCQGKMAFMAGVWYAVLKAFDVFQLLTHSKPAMTSSILFVFVPNSLPGASRYVVMRYVIWKYCRYVSFKALYVTLYYYALCCFTGVTSLHGTFCTEFVRPLYQTPANVLEYNYNILIKKHLRNKHACA